MKIVIPMSGTGQRFVKAGYKDPKPLIRIDGRPMIEHVVNMFPRESDFIFICNDKHLQETAIESVLRRIAPACRIVRVPEHKKGPVYAVSFAFDMLDDEEEVIINYCDFCKYWDFSDFLGHTRGRNAAGCVTAYRGFHPHMLGGDNYAFIKEERQFMLEIQEKKPFTNNKMNEYASDGMYYFKKGKYVKKYFKEQMEKDVSLNGEYYVSMTYNLLIRDGLPISVYKIQHMCQWGTPRDLMEFIHWSDYFRGVLEKRKPVRVPQGMVTLIPMAGRGMRFQEEGYADPKPLIPVSGRPMIVQAVSYLPESERSVFICLKEHLDHYDLEDALRKAVPNVEIISLDHVTNGQACTCEIGMGSIDDNAPVLIAACDNGMLWNTDAYQDLMDDGTVDAIVWSFRHHPSSANNPNMYGWVKTDERGNALGVSVKKAISDTPYNDHAITGTFFFRKKRYFMEALESVYKKNIRVNNEFYVDSCMGEMVELGRKVKVFEVENYIGWGTPNDYRTFEYWQSFFHKWPNHPYRLEKDGTVNRDRISELDEKYRAHSQDYC